MITIPTTELIGCISAVLPVTLDEKHNSLAGVAVEWDGEALNFTTYDVVTGATVRWIPGEGAEGTIDSDEGDDIRWGAENEAPWRVFIGYADAKEIVKLFKLPAKLWRYPVRIKTNISLTKLIVERDDMSRGERLLTVSTDNDVLRNVPNVRQRVERTATEMGVPSANPIFNGARLASLGASTAYGVLKLSFGDEQGFVGAQAGSRYAAFIYQSGANPRPYNVLRDGSGLVTS